VRFVSRWKATRQEREKVNSFGIDDGPLHNLNEPWVYSPSLSACPEIRLTAIIESFVIHATKLSKIRQKIFKKISM
jgi:hypothetical protein